MKRVNYVELCTYLSNVYKESTNTYYSNEPSDWLDDLMNYESNATYLGTTNNGQVENYEVDDIKYIDVVSNFYLSSYNYRKYVKNEV